MKKRLLLTLIVLLTSAIVISACSLAQEPAPTPTAAMADDAMGKEDSMSKEDAMGKDDAMAKEEDMAKEDNMDKSESMADEDMKKDDSMASDDSMDKQDEAMDKDGDMASQEDGMASDDAMNKDDNMASDDSMKKEDDSMASDESMDKENDESMASDDAMKKEEDASMSGDAMMKASLSLSFANLPDLGPGWAYEGWLIVDGKPVTTGVFTVDQRGMASAAEFSVDAEALKQATAFVLTIEPSPDDDPAPSPIHIIGGDFDGDAAALTVNHPLALGVDFDGVKVSYILGAPSSEMAAEDYRQGIWWPGLDLPTLPQGWVYEGWVAGPDGPISTGRFTSGDMADSDGNGPTAGPKPGPSFPGQDFINPPIDLTSGYAAVISIEPDPDNSPLPFALKPFVDENIEDVGDHGSQDMTTRTDGFPTGQAQR